MLFMERQPHFQVLNNQQGKLINFEEKLQPRLLFHLPLLLKFEIFPIRRLYWGRFLKNKKICNAPNKCFYVNTT